tara:strand:+ start:52 stop:756 length:705 start_codon:yes stop_codon:yes gene_type:complete
MISFIIPVFNEEKNIKNLIEEILLLDLKNEYEIIIVNDCSSDNSKKICEKFLNFKNFFVINNDVNIGQSKSIFRGIKESKFNIICTLDGDGQNDPKDIPKLLNIYIKNIDVNLVSGIRKNRKDSYIKKISSIIANKIRKKILNDDCDDTGCSLKVFNKKIFLKFPLFNGIHRFLPALFKGYGHKCLFISVNHRKRKFGISNYGTFGRLFRGILDIYRVKKIIQKRNNSLKSFHE